MNELVFASILLTAVVVTFHGFSGHITLWYNMKCTLFFPANWLDSILARPAESCYRMVFPISLYETLDVYCLPTLQIGYFAMQGIFSPPIVKVTLSFRFPFCKDRLLEVISSSSLFKSLGMQQFGARPWCHPCNTLVGGASVLQRADSSHHHLSCSSQDHFECCYEKDGGDRASHCDPHF